MIISVVVANFLIAKDNSTIVKPDTTIKKFVDEEADMMCYYTDTWGSCFYVIKD